MKEFFTVASVWGHNAVASTASSSSPSSSLLILLLLLLPPEVILSAGSFLTLLICFIVESLANFFITRASSEPSYLLLSSSSISSSSSSPSTTALPSYGVGGGTVGEEDDDDEFSPSSSVLMGEGLASKRRLSDSTTIFIERSSCSSLLTVTSMQSAKQHKSFISLIAHSLENPLILGYHIEQLFFPVSTVVVHGHMRCNRWCVIHALLPLQIFGVTPHSGIIFLFVKRLRLN
uniref:Wsv154 n=1 Tax=White spot syndrome virus TaxID=92652 RepID=A0A2U9G6G0_WSSV|nr:wsv154 [Shrimp white spot syndrome virus]